MTLSSEASKALREYQWKGNIRELENVMQRACLLSDGIITSEDLGISAESVSDMTPGSVKDVEKQLIMKTLEETGGNRSQAARVLGISVRTLRNKLKLYGQPEPDEEIFSRPAGARMA